MRGQALLYIKDLGKHDDTFALYLGPSLQSQTDEINFLTHDRYSVLQFECLLESHLTNGTIQLWNLEKSAALELRISHCKHALMTSLFSYLGS